MPVLSLDDVVAGIMARPAVGGTRVVGVDGPSGSGKSTLACRLRARLPGSGLVEVDDFVSWPDFGGWWPRLVDQVLDPLVSRRDARYQVRDWVNDEFGTGLNGWKTLAWSPVVIVEGVTCTRRAARPYLAYSIWVEAPEAVRLERGVARDGQSHRELWLRWMAQEREFFAADQTSERADLRVSGSPVPGPDAKNLVLTY